jgi:hypothetical protein
MTDTPVRVRTVTNSELQTFKGCRRRWWLSSHRKLTPKRKNLVGPLPLGTRVHAALEVIHQGKDPVERYLELQAADIVTWGKYWADLGLEPTTEESKKFVSQMDLGRIMVEGYVEWAAENGIDADYDELLPEEKVHVFFNVISGVQVWLMGKLDLRVRRKRDGARLFVDYKTVGTTLEQKLASMQLDEQFYMYQLLERLLGLANGDPALTQGSMVQLLRKVKRTGTAKPPFYAREEIHRSDVQLRNFWERLNGEIRDLIDVERELEQGASHHYVAYPRPSSDCSWICEFKTVCPMFDDGSDAERFLEDHFESYDPLERYAQKEDTDE